MGQAKTEAAFGGEWRIASTDLWDREALDLVKPAFIRFEDEGLGAFGMIAIAGSLHCYYSERDGRPLVEFTWEGEDDCDPRCGRGWAAVHADGTLRGRLFIHLGDDSGFVAERATKARARRGPRRQPRMR